MRGQVLVLKSPDYLFVRFEQMGPSRRFNALLNTFLRTFPLADWNEEEAAWCLPLAQLDSVTAFVQTHLGPQALWIQAHPNPSVIIRQMSFFEGRGNG